MWFKFSYYIISYYAAIFILSFQKYAIDRDHNTLICTCWLRCQVKGLSWIFKENNEEEEQTQEIMLYSQI